jgi:hypothetical protein
MSKILKSNLINIIVIDKNGIVKETCIKLVNNNFDYENLYKKCGFKNNENFIKQCFWNNILIDNKKISISVYAKTCGRANLENKYEFPPPIDNKLFFGNVCIIGFESISDGTEKKIIPFNLTNNSWKIIYDKLYGGFEDLTKIKSSKYNDEICDNGEENEENDEDENDEDELKYMSFEKLTKTGYLKNDFIVDDDYEENEEEEIKNSVSILKKNKKKNNKYVNEYESDIKCEVFYKDEEEELEEEYDIEYIGKELSEEEYIEE